MGKVSESIFSGLNHIIPMAGVSHIERHWYSGDVERTRHNYRGLIVVTKHTTWDKENDFYANNVYISAGEDAENFLRSWCNYRAELESETLQTPPRDQAAGEADKKYSTNDGLDEYRQKQQAAECELLPCPFCGAELIANNSHNDMYVQKYGAHYNHPVEGDCLLNGSEVAPHEKDAWQRRAVMRALRTHR